MARNECTTSNGCGSTGTSIISDKQKGHIPFIVIATAGSVSTGAIDPLEEISLVCTRHNCWFHIDGAYGTPAVIVPEVSHLFKGLELADSIALDPHKWLYSPLEAGCVLTRHPQALQDAFSFRPEYYNFDGKGDEPVINFHESGLQNSRGFRALKVWIMLQQAGINGYRQMISDDIKLASALFEMVQIHPELEGISHHLSIVNFRFTPADARRQGIHYMNKLNEEIVNRVQAGGEAFVSNAIVEGRYCIRVCIVNFRTKMDDLRALTEIVLRTGKTIHEEWNRDR